MKPCRRDSRDHHDEAARAPGPGKEGVLARPVLDPGSADLGYFSGSRDDCVVAKFRQASEFLEGTQWLDSGKLLELQRGELQRIVERRTHALLPEAVRRSGIEISRWRGPEGLAAKSSRSARTSGLKTAIGVPLERRQGRSG